MQLLPDKKGVFSCQTKDSSRTQLGHATDKEIQIFGLPIILNASLVSRWKIL